MLYEFEIFETEEDPGWYLVMPFDFGGGTSGQSLEEAEFMAHDFLQIVMEDCYIHKLEYPKATFGNEPRHPGGRILLVSCDDPARTIRKTTPADAARILGISQTRVSQLAADGCTLEMFTDEFGKKWVTMGSIEARLAERPKPGRPSKKEKEAMARVRAARGAASTLRAAALK